MRSRNGYLKDCSPSDTRFAYKNIEEVMSNQNDLVTPVKRLKTVGVVKG